MKSNKPSFFVASVLFGALLALSSGALDVRAANSGATTFAAARTAKEQCINVCRARYRDCFSLKQIPSFECRGVYQDCIRYTCDAIH